MPTHRKGGPKAAFPKPVAALLVRRIALPTRPIIRLERVVRSAIGPIFVIAPSDVSISVRRYVRLAGNRSSDDRTQAEDTHGIPKPVRVPAVARAPMLIAAMAFPISPPGVVALSPVLPVMPELHVNRVRGYLWRAWNEGGDGRCRCGEHEGAARSD